MSNKLPTFSEGPSELMGGEAFWEKLSHTTYWYISANALTLSKNNIPQKNNELSKLKNDILHFRGGINCTLIFEQDTNEDSLREDIDTAISEAEAAGYDQKMFRGYNSFNRFISSSGNSNAVYIGASLEECIKAYEKGLTAVLITPAGQTAENLPKSIITSESVIHFIQEPLRIRRERMEKESELIWQNYHRTVGASGCLFSPFFAAAQAIKLIHKQAKSVARKRAHNPAVDEITP